MYIHSQQISYSMILDEPYVVHLSQIDSGEPEFFKSLFLLYFDDFTALIKSSLIFHDANNLLINS